MSNTVNLRQTEKFAKTFRIMRFCAKLLGVDVLDPKYQMNLITCMLVTSNILLYCFNIYTVITYISEDFGILFECSCICAGAFIGTVKYCSAIVYKKDYRQLYIMLFDIYKTYEPKGRRYQQAMENCTNKFTLILKVVGAVYMQMTILAGGLTVAHSLYKGKRYSVLNFEIPGLDIETDTGYWLLFAFHMVCVFIAGFGLFSGDLFNMTSLTHAVLFVDIFEAKIQELNDIVDEDDSPDEQNESNVQDLLNDIVHWHQKYFEFTNHCNQIFNPIITVQVFSATFSIVMTILIIWTRDWPMAYAYLFFGFNSLYEYCLIGTQIEICNDKFVDAIYKIHWYNLNISQQKMVLLMLNRSQSSDLIFIGGVVPLSVSTGLSITRSIYSMVMMMVQFY